MPIKNLPRLFSDLIFDAESKFGNYNPQCHIELGDYGYMDPQSGVFTRQGNIFHDERFQSRHAELVAAIGEPRVSSPSTTKTIISDTVREIETDASKRIKLPGFELHGSHKFRFGRKNGLILHLVRPVVRSFPNSAKLVDLLKAIRGELKGQVIVTEVTTCDAYAFILSCGVGQTAEIHFGTVNAPQPTPPEQARGVSGSRWHYESSSGVWNVGSEPQAVYVPIYELRMLGKRWYQDDSAATLQFPNRLDALQGDLELTVYLRPWGPLDEDGEEIPDDEEDEE